MKVPDEANGVEQPLPVRAQHTIPPERPLCRDPTAQFARQVSGPQKKNLEASYYNIFVAFRYLRRDPTAQFARLLLSEV